MEVVYCPTLIVMRVRCLSTSQVQISLSCWNFLISGCGTSLMNSSTR